MFHWFRVGPEAALAASFAVLLAPGLGAQSRKPLVEAALWGSYSTFPGAPGSDDAGAGLRTVELALWPSAQIRLFGRYDNSLSLDNLTLLRAGRRVPLWTGGALFNWGGRFTTVLHAGRRTLPGRIGQTLLGMEQVLYLDGGSALKAGAEAAPREDDRTEWTVHGGISLPAGSHLRLEPTLFYARSGVPGESQWRGLLAGTLGLGRSAELAAGVAGGHNRSFDGAFTGAVWDSYARISLALGGLKRLHLLARHERATGADNLTTVAAGLSLAVPRP
jgi:hypothetical protein